MVQLIQIITGIVVSAAVLGGTFAGYKMGQRTGAMKARSLFLKKISEIAGRAGAYVNAANKRNDAERSKDLTVMEGLAEAVHTVRAQAMIAGAQQAVASLTTEKDLLGISPGELGKFIDADIHDREIALPSEEERFFLSGRDSEDENLVSVIMKAGKLSGKGKKSAENEPMGKIMEKMLRDAKDKGVNVKSLRLEQNDDGSFDLPSGLPPEIEADLRRHIEEMNDSPEHAGHSHTIRIPEVKVSKGKKTLADITGSGPGMPSLPPERPATGRKRIIPGTVKVIPPKDPPEAKKPPRKKTS
jgi:hypothetical protein